MGGQCPSKKLEVIKLKFQYQVWDASLQAVGYEGPKGP